MTEIRIEKKRSLLPWLLGGLVLLAIILYFFWIGRESKPQEEQTTVSLISVRENNATVNDYIQFVGQDSARMSLDHTYTTEAISRLTNAIQAMADEIGFEVKADMEKVKEHAAKITEDPFATTHADHIRKATDILSTSLRRMQQSMYSELDEQAAQVEQASAAIDPEVLTLQQKEAVKKFFNEAAELLHDMN